MPATSRIARILSEKGIVLPKPNPPTASYVPYVVAGNIVYIAGQGPRVDGALQYAGKVGSERSIEDGQAAARICMLNVLAHLHSACDGDLDRVARAVRVAGLVNCLPDFLHHPTVLNGASDLLLEVFGDAGRHARIATGASSLPFDMSVEIEAQFEIR